MKQFIRFIFIFILGLAPVLTHGQVSIPREGFPYCEPFTGSAADLRPETILGAGPNSDPAFVGNGYLRLTNNLEFQSGYVYIDIPFSAQYGIKASFEYASYGGSNPGADGFSFFLFDGRYGDTSKGAQFPFQIGGFGGSLGYAPRTWPAPTTTRANGMTGAYIGVAFDEWGNFVREFEKDSVAHLTPLTPSPFGLGNNIGLGTYPHTISIRGPEVVSSPFVPYGLVDYKEVNAASFPFPFKIDSAPGTSSPGFNCPDLGANPNYRKIFVELVPEGVGYRVFVKMRVGSHWSEPEIDIFPGGVLYPYIPPDQIKIGFAAASGQSRNNHLIRNLAVDVSTVDNVARPEVSPAEERTCVDQEVTILIDDVILKQGATFIQCVQLYDPALLGTSNPPWESSSNTIPHLECGIADICGQCSSSNLTWPVPGIGVFNLEPLGDLELDSNGNLVGNINDILVTFTPDPGAVGTAEVLYTAQDNFGLVSEPQLIRVIINPIPEILNEVITNPTCDGQNDGALEIEVGNLLDGATYRWLFRPVGSMDPPTPIFANPIPIPNIVNGEAVISLANLNLGEYFLEANNPLDNEGNFCVNVLPEILLIDQEAGTPVEVEADAIEICQGTDAVLRPSVPPQYIPDPSNPPSFLWYDNPTRGGGPLVSNGTDQIDGVNVTLSTSATGELTINGLTALNTTQERVYTLYVEVAPDDDFCNFLDEADLVPVQITVFPPLSVSNLPTPDWCRDNAGQIQITALGGKGDKTFILFDDLGNELETLINPTSVTFSGLLPGTYTIDISSENPTCIDNQTVVIQGPVDDLTIAEVSKTEATCDLNNGTFTFEVAGGNGVLTSSNISITGGPNSGLTFDPSTDSFTYSGLQPGVNYTVTVTDERNCSEPVSFTIDEIQTPTFSLSGPTEVCEDQSSVEITVSNDFFELNGIAVPVFNWYSSQTGGSPISNGTGPSGLTYSIDNATGNLSISGLIPTTLTIWLEMAGPDACNLDRKPYSLTINPLPEADFTPVDISCFGGNDGTLEVIGGPVGSGTFTYNLIQSSSGNIVQTETDGTFSGLIAGDYRVRITNDDTGCVFETDTYTLTEPAELEIIDVDADPTTCGISNNGQIVLTVTGGTPPYTFTNISRNGSPLSGLNPSASGTTYTFSGLEAGNYVIVFEDANDCAISETEIVGTIPVPDISIAIDSEYCFGEQISLIPTIAETGTLEEGVTYTWLANGTALTGLSGNFAGGMYSISTTMGITPPTLALMDIEPNNYTFTLEVRGTGSCDLDFSETVIVNPLPEAEFTPANISCFNGSDGTLEVIGVPLGSGPFTYELIQASSGNVIQKETDGTFSGLTAGEYRVRIINDATACEYLTGPYTLTEPTALEIQNVIPTPTTCGLPNNGQIILTVAGGTAPYSFVSISRGGTPLSGLTPSEAGTTYTFNGLEAGSYDIVFKDANGCEVTENESIGTTPVPDISIAVNPEFCFGDPIVVIPSITEVGTLVDPVTYTWVVNGTTLNAPNGTFAGGTYTISTSAGINPPTLTLINIQANSYTFTLQVRGSGSCDLDFSENTTVNPLPDTQFEVQNALCFGGLGSISLSSGGASGHSYGLNTGETNTTGVFSDLPVGDYTIVITNSFGCTQTLNYTITQPDELRITPVDFSNPTCEATNGVIVFDLVGGVEEYEIEINGTALNSTNFDFSRTGNTYTIENLAPGSYAIGVTDTNLCTLPAVDLFQLVNDNGFDVQSLPIQQEICEGGTASLFPQLTIPAGANPVLNWFFDASATQPITSSSNPAADGHIYEISASGELTVSNLQQGSYTYYLKISGTNICEQITEATVTVIPPIEATATPSPVTCFGDSNGSIQVSAPTGGNGTYEFSLDGSTWQPASLFEGLIAGSYTVYVRDNSGLDGCLLSIPDIIIDTPSAPIEENQGVELPVSCGLDNGAVRDVLVTGGWGNYTFEWRKDDPTTGSVLSQGTITGIEDLAQGTYFLIITDDLGCVAVFDYTIGVASDPVYELVDPIDACFGSPIQINPIHIAPDPSLPPSAATEIRWYKGPGQTELISNGPDAADPSVIYTIDDTDWLNPALKIENLPVGTHDFYFYVVCTGQEIKIDIVVFDTPAVVFESDPVSCFGESDGKIRLVSGTNTEYTYSINGATAISQAELEALTFAAGNYSIQVNTPAGCPQVVDVEVEGPSGPLEIQLVSQLDPSCNLDNGQILLRLLGGNPDYVLTMNGSPVTGFDLSQDGTEILFENLAGGTYQFEISDQKACAPASASITLAPLEVPEFDAQGDEICAFDPTSGTPNTGVLTPVIVNQAGSTPVFNWYYVNASGTEVLINSGDAVLGGTANVTASGQLELTGLASQDDPYLFYLEVLGDLVCPGPKIEAPLQVNFTPEVVFEKMDILCFGETTGRIAVQSGALPGFTYTLNSGETNDAGTFENLPAGTYTVEVSNGTSCIQSVQIEIEQPDELVINAIDFTDPTCDAINGEFIFSITGGIETYSIAINGQELNTSNFTFAENSGVYTVQNLALGTYSISVTDANGCPVEAPDLFTLTNNPGINIDSNPISEEICEGEVGQLIPDLTFPSGVNPVLRWYRDASASQEIVSSSIPDQNGIVYQINSQGVLSITGLPDGVFEYYLRISGPGICTQITPATLTVTARPEVTIQADNISCFGANDGRVSVASGHDASYVYSLSNGNSNSTGEFSGLTPGNYTLEVENTSGCIQILNFEIEEPAELIISPVDFTNPTCDEENGEIIFEVIGGTGDYTILINGLELNDSNFAFIQSGNSYQVKGLGPNAYSIEVRDENACSKTEADLFTLVNESGILIGSNPLFEEIMLGEVGVLTPDLTIPSGAVFELNWYFDANATQIITSNPSPAADGVTYQIDGNGELTVTDLPPGTYAYYYEISGDGICVTLTEAVLVVKSPLTADIITTDVTCFGGSDGSISVENIDGGTPPLSFSLDAVNWQSSPRFEDLPVGMYSVYISDATISVGFLTSFQNIEITTTATEIVANIPDLIPAQCDLPNGAIRNLVISGGTGTYTFEWRKDDPVSGEVQSGGALSGIENVFSGTYYLSVTDSNGCQEVFEFEVEELPDPVFEVVPPIDICLGESAVIQPVFIAPNPPTPTAASEIRWYKDAGQIGLISDGPDPENASILYAIDDSDGINPVLTIENLPVGAHDFYFYVVCTGQEIKVDVTVYEIPQMAFETSPVTCFGDSNGKISAISGSLPDYTYSLNGATPGSLQDLESLNLTAGDYSLDVITPAGCAQSLSVTIEGPEAPLTLADLNPIDPGCGADNGRIRAQITGGWAPYTINLYREGSLLTSVTQSDSNLLFENLSIGTYLIEIIDDKGCRIESPVIDLVDGPTQILVDDQEACEGAVITLVPRLDPPVAVYTVQWFFDAAATQPIVSSPTPAADGVIYEIAADGTLTMTGLPYSPTPYQYFATATGSDVCVGFLARPRVKINEIPALSATIIEEQCFGSGGILEITATGGSGGYEYSVDGITFQASNTFNLQPGTYDITVRTGQGCEAVISGLVITGPPAPIAIENLAKVDATCGQEDGSLSFTVQGGYGGYEVDLLLDGNLVHTATTEADGSIAFSGLETGIYTVVVRDTGGCEISFENLTEIQNVPTLINVNDEMICEGESATLIPNVPTSSPDLQFAWYLDAQATQPVQNGPTGDVTYTIGADGSLTVSGLAPSATPYEYFVWASGTDICRDTPEKASILVTALPNLRVSNPSIVCDPTGTVDLTDYIQGFNPAVYDYNVISPVGTKMRLEDLTDVNQSGSYLVSSSAKSTGCWNQPQRILVVIAETLLEAEFNYLVDLGGGNIFQNQDIPLGEDVYFNDLSRGNAVKWTWDFGDGFTSEEQNPVHNYDEVGTFTVQLRVLDSIGCISIYEMVVNVLDDFKVIIPNAFTPQGTKNQYFKPEFRGISSMEFYIFNTWGELIYQTNSLEDLGWDGTLNGKDAPNGNYVYRGRFVSKGGEVIEKSGVFILIR